MGLDIVAYRQLTPNPGAELDGDGYPVEWDTNVRLDERSKFTEEQFPGRSEGIPDAAVCTFSESFAFRAGSYGGYNEWRNELAKLAGFESAQDFWDNATDDAPFFELINFSDCEGIIGPKASAELAKDFASHTPHDAFAGWFAENYENWKTAFEMAADGGAVDFR